MCYGIETAQPDPQEIRFGIEAAACQFGVSVDELKQYAREGLLISLEADGVRYYAESDYQWVGTVRRLLLEAHLSFEDIRRLIARCLCWKCRHCDFHSRYVCPLNKDPSKPCWVNRAMCTVLSSYPCYCCVVYRSAGDCEGVRALLKTHGSSTSMAYGYYGG